MGGPDFFTGGGREDKKIGKDRKTPTSVTLPIEQSIIYQAYRSYLSHALPT